MGIGDFFSDLFKATVGAIIGFFIGGPIGAIVGFGLGFASDDIVGALIPKLPQPSDAARQSNQVYNVDAQQNAAKLGAPQAVVYGLVRRWPELRSQTWSEFIGDDQVLHLYMRLTVGIASISDVRVGKTPATSYAGFEQQLCLPGERMTLFHPNVYTNQQTANLQPVGGVLVTRRFTGAVQFSGTLINHDGGAGVFAGAFAGGWVHVQGAGAGYDGRYTVTAQDGGAETVNVSGASFAAATINCTVVWQLYDSANANYKHIDSVPLAWDAALSTVRCTDAARLSEFAVFAAGDIIRAEGGGAGANENLWLDVLGVSGDGDAYIVSPHSGSLTTLTGTCNLVLLQRWHGPFDGCPAGAVMLQAAIDLVWPQGLCSINSGDGSIGAWTSMLEVQARQINDVGSPLTGWQPLPICIVEAATRNPVRRTVQLGMPSQARWQFRLSRSSKDDNYQYVLDDYTVAGLKGYIDAPAGEDHALDEYSTTLAVTLRGSGALAGQEDRKLNCMVQRWLETYDAEAGQWLPEQPTRGVHWAALDKLRGRYTRAGRQLPDASLDLAGYLAFGAQCEAVGATFDGAFETESTLLQNLQTILRVGRAGPRYDWRTGQHGVYRDQPAAPVLAFTDLNGEVSDYALNLRDANAPTGILVSYQDSDAWEERTVGVGDTDTRPQRVDMRNGCTSRDTAWREANYQWNELLYRNRTCSVRAEMEPMVLRYGDRVLLQSAARRWGQCARVTAATGRALAVWPPLDWSWGGGYTARLIAPTGAPGAAIACERGDDDAHVLLSADPDVEITGDAAGEEQTILLLDPTGFSIHGDAVPLPAQTGIIIGAQWQQGPEGGHTCTLQCKLEDTRVFTAPGPAPADPYAINGTAPALSIDDFAVTASGATLTATWTVLPAAALFELEYSYGGNWITAYRGSGNAGLGGTGSHQWSVPSSGVIECRIRAYGDAATIGDWAADTVTVTAAGGALAVSIAPLALSATTTGPNAITGTCTGTASGGIPPYSYAWIKASGDAITATAPTTSSTQFQALGLDVEESRTAQYRLRVTDSTTATADSALATVTLTNTYRGSVPPSGGYLP